MSKTFILVEHNRNIYDNLSFAFETRNWDIVWLKNEKEVFSKARFCKYEFVLIDHIYRKIDASVLLPYFHTISGAPVIVATKCNILFNKIFSLLAPDRDSFITKPINFRELHFKISELLNKNKVLPYPTSNTGTNSPTFVIDLEKRNIIFCGTLLELTLYQYRILLAMLEKPMQVFDFEKLSTIASDDENVLVEKQTVTSHICRIRNTLYTISKEIRLLVSQRGFGFSFISPADYDRVDGAFIVFEGKESKKCQVEN